jgi:hypothetical protein
MLIEMNVFLTDVSRNYAKYDGARIDNLMVDAWGKLRWNESDISCLLLMCRKHEVKRLFFVPNRGKVMWHRMLLMGYGHLPLQLKSILVHHDGDNLPFHLSGLFAVATIRSISCYILSSDVHAIRSRTRSFLDFMWSEKWLHMEDPDVVTYNRTVREIKFDTLDHCFLPSMMPPNDFIPGREVMRIVEGNWSAWKNCQVVSMILLSRRIRMMSQIDINVYRLIAKQVWATRDSPVWIPRTSLVQTMMDKFKK